jgi:signal peptidase I
MSLSHKTTIRHARRQAKDLHKAYVKLRARAEKRNLSKEVAELLQSKSKKFTDELEGQTNPQKLMKACESFDILIDQHLGVHRKAPWRESLEQIALAILLALVVRSFVVEAFKIPSGSMIPSLAIGDQIFVTKYSYGVRVPFTSLRVVDFDLPERGTVVVFICPIEPHDDYIKRVVGLPGDEIAVRDDGVFVNGKALHRTYQGTETFIDKSPNGRWVEFSAERYEEVNDGVSYSVLQDPKSFFSSHDFGPVMVPEKHLFVMGDNRDHSSDSRAWGFVPQENVLGKSLFVWWSWGRDGLASERLGTWTN